MRRRVDVDETLPPAAIPGRILHELYAHALETLPEECCGLILGNERERFGRLIRCRNEMTRLSRGDPEHYPRDGREAFYMSERDYLAAQAEADAADRHVTVVYHSHVDEGAYLSEMDLEYAEHELFPFPTADHIVVSVVNRKVGALGFFEQQGGRFRGRRVEAIAP